MLKNNISFKEIRKSTLSQLSFLLKLLIEYAKEEEKEILSRLEETEEGYL